MNVEVKFLVPDLYSPQNTLARQTEGSVGFDLRVTRDLVFQPGDFIKTGTGIALNMAGSDIEGLFAMVAIRSSMGAKGLALTNSVGIIDKDYQGELGLMLRYEPTEYVPKLIIKRGERVAQLIFMRSAHPSLRLQTVTEFTATTQRGEDGYGSTGQV